jgi:hypothetical protein
MRHEPIALPRIHPSWCSCEHCNPTPTSLIERFAAAAAPGDFASLWLGTKIGIVLWGSVAIADNWSAIVEFVRGAL